MAKLKFAQERVNTANVNLNSYKVLVVDDESSIHEVTNMSLSSMDFSDFKLEIFNAYSAKEAKEILDKNSDIALALIDVVMETPEAGLDLVNYIRTDLKNEMIRLVIRTGQANEFPEIDVIRKYDINDFKEKTELTVERIFTTVRSSIKQYQQLVELNNKYEETYKQMTTNSLTKLYNRIKLYEDCDHQKRSKTLILIDIIGFSSINENSGYETGDYVLKEIAGFLHSMYTDEFTVYHLDSDLFALVSRNEYFENIFNKVEKIQADISQLHIVTNNFNKTIDTTIGVAIESEKNLIRKAELALKEARNSDKSKIQYYSDDLKIIKKLNDINYWGPLIRDGLNNGNIIPYYQAIYDLKTDTIHKYELLIRLKHEGEVYPPFKFMAPAKHTGQMYDIFKFMFEKACIQAEKTGMRYSVNIGDSEFTNDDIVEFISKTIKNYKINPSLLSLEILEYHSISSKLNTKDTITEISSLGVKILIDDFGINCSNFGQLEGLPVDTIKIDGSFIQNLPESKNSQIIVKAIQTFAREKNIKLVAEFISSQEVLEIVKSLGIEYGQGFHLGVPSPSL